MWQALGRRDAESRQGETLRRIAYPRQRPRVWGLFREELLIGLVQMMPPNPDGSVSPNFITACSRPRPAAR